MLFHIDVNLLFLVIYSLVLGLFVHDLSLSQWALGEFDEQESHTRVVEESIFGLFAVLVHGFSGQLEVNLGAVHHALDVFLLVVMAQHDWKHAWGEFQKKAGVQGFVDVHSK